MNYLNSAVDEAVLERIEKLQNKISELQSDISCYEKEIARLDEYHLKYLEVQDYDYERNNENR
jgi:peptidoglycan hydrolase CwlO-like protein